MEETKDFNLEEIREYLKENGLDENLANSPVFIEKFSTQTKTRTNGGPARLIVYFDKENNLITPYFRDVRGNKTKGPETRIRKEGKTILIEELSRYQESIHYVMDDPTGIGENSEKNTIIKVTYYLDENGEVELAKETRQNSRFNDEVSKEDLYSESAEVKYEINEDGLKDKNPSDYHSVIMMKKIAKLENDVQNLTQENKRQTKMLEKTISFAENVRNSAVGRLFFGKKVNEVLGEKHNNVKRLPETSSLDER